jgi:membrane-associated phospholipid phosphatase
MKDLFFSGHTSTLFLLFLTAGRGRLKILFLCCTIAVAATIIIHHSHYAVDVFVAPFVAYTSYRIAYLLNKKFDPTIHSY